MAHNLLCDTYFKHEVKNCSRCNTAFECKVGSITICQCTTVELTHEEIESIREKYNDCLCAECMKSFKKS